MTEDLGIALETADTTVLGKAGKIVATKDRTVIVEGKGKKADIAERITSIKASIAQTSGSKLDSFTKEHLEKRIAKLSQGVAVIRVGAATETEMKYLKLKVEDAVNATKAAIEEGIVPGGGVALAKVAGVIKKKLLASPRYKKAQVDKRESEFVAGYTALVDALTAPIAQIAKSAGHEESVLIIDKVQSATGTLGYDAATDSMSGEIELVDMMQKGIIDPVKVTRTALQNAASAAGILITTDVAIADEPEPAKPLADMGAAGMY